MRHISEIMKELGFKKDSDEETQKAFIRHLIEAARVSDAQRPRPLKKAKNKDNQLSFPTDVLDQVSSNKKSS